jgi:Tannase and feruloyl esterase
VNTQRRRLLATTGSCAALAILLGLALGADGSGGSTTRAAASGALAHRGPLGAVILPRRPCGALMQTGSWPMPGVAPGVTDFSTIPGAPTRVVSANVVAATVQSPAYCDVKGYIAPQIQFELRLPTATWQGRYLQDGCSGFCGAVYPPTFQPCAVQPGGNFAVASTDDGHVDASPGGFDGLWARDDERLRIDYGYRATHVLAVAAKAIIAAYYGVAPRHTYFAGCSDGGREALMEAQRYPADFDGIIAGAPASIFAPLVGELLPWEADVNTDARGREILTAAKLPALHHAVIAACDADDGVIDGQIGDPRACHFDPAALRCPASVDRLTCLTPAQVDVARKLYAGPVDAQGRRLYPGGEPRGSELAWVGWLVKLPAGVPLWFPTAVQQGGDNYLRYMGFPVGQAGPPSKDWRFTVAGFNSLRAEGHIYNATDADLGAFHARGGRLIIWQGWADANIAPVGAPVYYQAVQDRMGGLAATQRFARLFMIPSMYHCAGGFGPDQFNLLTPLVRWVEQGTAPAKIIATQTQTALNSYLPAPSTGGKVVRTRPVFPYPMEARYRGAGSINSAASFVGVMPAAPPNDHVQWVGNDLFTTP